MTFAYVRKASETCYKDWEWWFSQLFSLVPNIAELWYCEQPHPADNINGACQSSIEWHVFWSNPRNEISDYQWLLMKWRIK